MELHSTNRNKDGIISANQSEGPLTPGRQLPILLQVLEVVTTQNISSEFESSEDCQILKSLSVKERKNVVVIVVALSW